MSSPATSARERLAAMQAADARKRRRTVAIIVTSIVLVVVLAAVAIMWAIVHHRDARAAANAGTITKATSVPASVFDAVGAGSAHSDFASMPQPKAQPQTKDGKPLVTYVGAEFCPYCAMDRWSLVAALSRFGTFKGLAPQTSSADEGPQLSNLQTLTFRDATYSSPYLAFKAYEMTDREHKPLQPLPAEDEAFFKANKPTMGIPWVNWRGQVSSGVNYNGFLIGGKSGDQIADAMHDSDDTLGKGIIGSANIASAYICTLTHNQPASVCDSPGVKAAAKKLSVAKAGS